MKRPWFALTIVLAFMVASVVIMNVHSEEKTMIINGDTSDDLTAAQYPINLLDGIWYESDGVDTPPSGFQTQWNTIAGTLGEGTYPWERSFFDGTSTTGLAGLFTTDGHTVDFTAAAAELDYDMDAVTIPTGTSSDPVSNTHLDDGTPHTTNGAVTAPLGYAAGDPNSNTQLDLFGAYVSFVGTGTESLDTHAGWDILDTKVPPTGFTNGGDWVRMTDSNQFTLTYGFTIPNHEWQQVTSIAARCFIADGGTQLLPTPGNPRRLSKLKISFPGSSVTTTSDEIFSLPNAAPFALYPMLMSAPAHYVNYIVGIQGNTTNMSTYTSVAGIRFDLVSVFPTLYPVYKTAGGYDAYRGSDVALIVAANSPGQIVVSYQVEKDTARSSQEAFARIYAIWLEVGYTTVQSYSLLTIFSLDLFNDDDHPANAVDPGLLNTLEGVVQVQFRDSGFTFTGQKIAYLLNPLGGAGRIISSNIGVDVYTDYFITPIITQPDTPDWIFPDGTIKIGIECQSDKIGTSSGNNIHIDVDFIQLTLRPLTIPFAQFDTTGGFDTVAIRGEGTFDIFTTGHTPVGTFASVGSYAIQAFALPSGIIDYLHVYTTTSGSIDWITFTDTPTISLRDIDKGSTTADLFGGNFYPDNTVPHDVTVTPTAYTQTAYFCANHPYEWFRTNRGVSFTIGGRSRDVGVSITYRMTGISTAPVQIGLRDTENTWHYRSIPHATTWATLEIPLATVGSAAYNQIAILISDGTGVGQSSVETITFEMSALDLIRLPIPNPILATPINNELILGNFAITGNVSDSDGVIANAFVAIDTTIVASFSPGTAFLDLGTITVNSGWIADGWHTIWLNATDDDATLNYDAVNIFIDNDPDPTVRILGDARQVCSDTLTIEADPVADVSATITKVDFYLDDTLVHTDTSAPYTIDFAATIANEGDYVLTVVATDSNAQVGSDSIQLLIDLTPPPLIEFLTINRTTDLYDAGYVTIDLGVTGITAAITLVEIYVDDALHDADTSSPYQYTLYFGGLIANGTTFTIQVRAYDALGASNWNEANITYYYTTTLPGGATVLDYIIDIFEWIVEFFTSTFGAIFGGILAIGSGAVAVSRHRHQLVWVASGGSILTGLLAGAVLSPTAGIGIGLVTGAITALGMGTGLLVRRNILPTVQTQCQRNPQMKRCQIILKNEDFLPVSRRPNRCVPPVSKALQFTVPTSHCTDNTIHTASRSIKRKRKSIL